MAQSKNQEVELRIYKDLDVLRATTVKNSVYFVYSSATQKVTQIWITTNKNIPKQVELSTPINLKTITSPDGTIEVVETSTEIQLELEASILALINSSLQAGNNVSSLVNDAGYITISDVPPFDPSNYDLEEFTNIGTDPFIKQSDIVQYTNEEAQDAIGTILSDTSTIDLSYNDGTPSISADVKVNSIDASHLSNSINVSEFINDSDYATETYVDSKIPSDYSKVVYVDSNNPNTATIFDLNNPPTVNDDILKTDVNNLYVGLNASTWVYNSTSLTYITELITSSTSNFYLAGTVIDAVGNKTTAIERTGTVGGAPATANNHFVTKLQLDKRKTELSYACSDEISDLTVGTLITFRMPVGLTLTAVKLSLNIAPTGSKVIVDIKKNGTTIFSTLISVDTSSTTSVGASVPAVISDTNLVDDGIITILTTQVGSTVAGKGLKVTLIGNRI